MAQITNSSLIALKDALTQEFFEHKIFSDDNQCFLLSNDNDRFVRPYDPLVLTPFNRSISYD